VIALLRDRKEAGRSADERFQAGLTAWRKRRRKAFAVVGAVCIAPAAIAYFTAPTPWNEISLFLAGAFFGMLAFAWDSPPEFIESWRRGAEGERRTAKALRPLTRHGWTVVHDIPGRYGNRDHVVVGPAGAFLLDTKNVTGLAEIDDGVLTVRRPEDERATYQYSRLASSITGASAGLRNEISARIQVPRLWVQAIVVVWPRFEGDPQAVGRVTYLGGQQLADWLSSLPTQMTPEQVAGVSEAVRQLRS
jgi:hypothetical protein